MLSNTCWDNNVTCRTDCSEKIFLDTLSNDGHKPLKRIDPFLANDFGSQILPSRNKTLRDTFLKMALFVDLAVVYCYFQVDFVWEPTDAQ